MCRRSTGTEPIPQLRPANRFPTATGPAVQAAAPIRGSFVFLQDIMTLVVIDPFTELVTEAIASLYASMTARRLNGEQGPEMMNDDEIDLI